jgi:hypothetical protein
MKSRNERGNLRIENCPAPVIVAGMNSQPGYSHATVQAGHSTLNRFGRAFPLFCLLIAAAGLFSGCARMRQYSLDSWQGPLPMEDLRYVQQDP